MRKAVNKIDKIILLCRNVDTTSSIYCQTLGLRVYLQSPQFVQLRDNNNFAIYLQKTRIPSQLSKGYSPILSFKVHNFQEVRAKLLRYELIPDGDVIQTKEGKLATFLGPDGETISINNLPEQQQQLTADKQTTSLQEDQIKRLLQKIKL